MSGVTVKPGEKAVVTCNVFGYPASNISWSYVYGNYTIGWPSRDRAPISVSDYTKSTKNIPVQKIFDFNRLRATISPSHK